MATRVNLEGLVEDVETHGAEQILMDLGQFRLSLKKRLNIDIQYNCYTRTSYQKFVFL